MTVNKASGPIGAALEAARKASEEAARRAAEQAAKAAQRHAQEEVALKAQIESASAQKPETQPLDHKGGWLGNITERVVAAAAGPTTPEGVKRDTEALKVGLADAKTPEDLKALNAQAVRLQAQTDVSTDPAVHGQLAEVRALTDRIERANTGAEQLAGFQRDLASTDPAVRANAQAALLSRPKELTDAVRGVAGIAESPVAGSLKRLALGLAGKIDPQALAKQLQAEPDLAKYPADMTRNLLALRAKQDPTLDAALDKVGARLLADATDGQGDNPLSYDKLKANPDLLRLVGPLQQSADPAVKAQFDKVVADWGKSILKTSLDGEDKGKDGTERAFGKFQDEMLGLAGMGLDPDTVAKATASTLEQNKGMIEDHCKTGGGGILGTVGGWFKDAAGWIADKVGDIVGFVKDKVGDIAKKAAEFFYDHVIDPALDHSALGEDTETFKAEKTGILGDLVTNRLEVGESAFVRLDANAKIAGVVLGGGAQMEIKRVPKLDERGEPVPPVNGVPQTNLEVHVLADARAGLGLEAKFGKALNKDVMVKGAQGEVGAGVGGGAKAEAGVRGQAELTFAFDATDPQAIEDMTGLFKETAETGLKAMVPGIGPILAATNMPDEAKAIASFGRHLETVRVEGGAYAQVSVEASAKVGAVKDQQNAIYKAGEQPKRPKKEKPEGVEDPKTLKDKALKAGAGLALDNGEIDVAGIQAAVGGDVSVGVEHNFKTGETTVYLQAKAMAKASANTIAGVGAGAGAQFNRKVALVLDADHQIKDIKVSEAYTKEQFAGLGRTDLAGRVDSAVLAQLSKDSTITVTRKYDGLDVFRGKNPLEIAGQVLSDANNAESSKNLVVDDITAKDTSKVELGGEVAGFGAKLTLGRTLEEDIEQDQWNETLKSVGRKHQKT